MTHIYNKVRDYNLNNKGRAKGFIDLVELILVSLTYPFIHLVHQEYCLFRSWMLKSLREFSSSPLY